VIVSCVGIGVGAESRIAIGEAYLLGQGPVCVTPSWVTPLEVESEIERFEAAIHAAAGQLHTVREQIPEEAPADIVEFLDTHLLMIQDKAISSSVTQLIREQFASAEWALQQHRDVLMHVFEQMDDPYLRTRRDDLEHVVRRIHKILLQTEDEDHIQLQGRIVLAEDLSPADVILLRNQQIAGFVTDFGGPMSHTAILARSLGLPAIVGARGASQCLRHGELLVLDTRHGCALANCAPAVLGYYEDEREFQHERALLLRKDSAEPAITADGEHIELLANIELTSDVQAAVLNGANGIGLYRTEFLYMNRRDIPDEEEHYAAYREVVDGMAGKPVTIRTLDLGADKQALDNGQRPCGGNPALGLRAIRLCLKEPELFHPQVRAILRASAHGDVRLMLPMLTNVWEVEQAKKVVDRCQQELRAEGIEFDASMPIGGMIEVPAAALSARVFAEPLDFLSIGTNDLIQYTLAIDRVDDEVNYLYDPFHPAVLQLIHHVIREAARANTPVSMCGEMAGDERFVPLLLGMGLRSFSMQPAALLDVKQQLRSQQLSALRRKADGFLRQMYEQDPLTLLSHWH
jgi:phosphotransferase system enzyme I (PtsI)